MSAGDFLIKDQKKRWNGEHPALRLFCFHYAGGGASTFRRWQTALPPRVEVVSVQLPGRENRLREKPYVRLGPLVDDLATQMQTWTDIPYLFFGHSMGAYVAFHLTREFRRRSLPGPAHLLVSGRQAPDWPSEKAPAHALPHDDFIEWLRELRGTPEVVLNVPELLRLVLPTLRADLEVLETHQYVAEEPLTCPITAHGGSYDRFVSKSSIEAWQRHTSSRFDCRMWPADHFFLHEFEDALLADIGRRLDELSLERRTRDPSIVRSTP